MTHVVLVGNSVLLKDYSVFVDKADYVIRFNYPKHGEQLAPAAVTVA